MDKDEIVNKLDSFGDRVYKFASTIGDKALWGVVGLAIGWGLGAFTELWVGATVFVVAAALAALAFWAKTHEPKKEGT
jgi:hypothetical protein